MLSVVKMDKKYCIVPGCYNSTVKTPDKLFFYVPEDPNMRKKWITATKRVCSLGPKTKAHCCEDHFDVENDMDNYVKYKLVGGKLKLKKGTVPHKFACHKQVDEKLEFSVAKKEFSVAKKLEIARLTTFSSECIASTSHGVEEIYIVDSIPQGQDIVKGSLKDVTKDENIRSTTKDINSSFKFNKKPTKLGTNTCPRVGNAYLEHRYRIGRVGGTSCLNRGACAYNGEGKHREVSILTNGDGLATCHVWNANYCIMWA